MKKLIRYVWKTIAWLTGILVFLWIALWILVELNEDKLINRISSAIQEKTFGEVKIGGASVSLIKTFPVLSLQLSDVLIRDSLFYVHKKDFLSVSDVYLRISLRELFRGRSAVGRITLTNGRINLITDSLGRSNEYILSGQKATEGHPQSSIPQIFLNNIGFNYENPNRRKLYRGNFRQLRCVVVTSDKFVTVDMGIIAHTDNFSFNTRRGSYLQGSELAGKFQLVYNKKSHDLLINHVHLNIDEQPFFFDGYFRIDRRISDFNIMVATNNIGFDKAKSLMPDSLASRLAGYQFSKPISFQVTITGETSAGNTPDVRIRMNIDMASVVSAAGITTMQFPKGTSMVDITIVSSKKKARDTLNGDLNGRIELRDLEIRYLPRNFSLQQCSGTIVFKNNDILIDSLQAFAGQTRLLMSGKTKNLFSLGNTSPGPLSMNWKISSPELHIRDFKTFIPAGKFSTKQSTLDKLFSTGNIYITASTPKMDYNHFKATQVNGQLVLTPAGIQLKKVSFNHAGGKMQLEGTLRNGSSSNPVTLHTNMEHMDVPLLFASFDNFGQDAITKDNLKGTLNADVTFSTAITNQGSLIPDQSRGTVEFLLENGELNNFEPLMAVSQKAFKKQDFSDIRFANLKNRLNISGTTFIINPMEIRSSAFTFFVEGVYDVKKGTDMSIRLPVRNLTKSQANTDLSEEAKTKKGLSVQLRARTGDDGKLKLSWDPFRRAAKNRKQVGDTLNTIQH